MLLEGFILFMYDIQVSRWVCSAILDRDLPQDRALVINHFITIAEVRLQTLWGARRSLTVIFRLVAR